MTGIGEWEFPAAAQPKAEEVAFELDRTLSSVVSLRSERSPTTRSPHPSWAPSVAGTAS